MYLHTFLSKNKNILMVLRNEFIDIMCEVNSDYTRHVIHLKNRKKILLYMKFLCTIYSCIESALYWYNIFSTTLRDKRFFINPHDRWVVNKIISNKQYTIVWYVDSNKLSHKDPEVVRSVLETIEYYFGN